MCWVFIMRRKGEKGGIRKREGETLKFTVVFSTKARSRPKPELSQANLKKASAFVKTEG